MTQFIPPPQSEGYIDGDIDNPFSKILCTSRTLMPTLCSGVCGNCKKERDTFFENEVQRQLVLERNNPKYGPGADQEILPDIKVLEQSIKIRITATIGKIEQKKGEILQLVAHTNERMKLLEKQLFSADASTTLQ